MKRNQIEAVLQQNKRSRTKTLEQARMRLNDIIEDRDECRRMYFWTPDRTASGRRYSEKRLSRDYTIDLKGLKVHYTRSVSMSCKIVYASDSLTGSLDGQDISLTTADIKKLMDGIDSILAKRRTEK